MTQLNLDLNRAKPAQIRSMYRAAMTTVAAEMAALREEGKGDSYPAAATFDRVIEAVRQARLLAEAARERAATTARTSGAAATAFGDLMASSAEPAGEAVPL